MPIDNAGLKELLQAYPYFTPARYMEASLQGRAKAFTPQSLQPARAYMGNWLLFRELMQLSAEEAPAPVVVMPEPPGPLPEATSAELPAATETETEHIMADQNNQQTKSEPREESLIQPVYSEDYFLHQGIIVDDQLPEELDHAAKEEPGPAPAAGDPKSLMVMMSFSEWLMHFRSKTQKEKEDEEDRKAVRSMWQREKLAAALEEEEDEIPENVFEMAVNSIAREDGLASESLAEILTKQGKHEQAIEMYKKLSLRNPQKSAYFAQQIAQIEKSSDL